MIALMFHEHQEKNELLKPEVQRESDGKRNCLLLQKHLKVYKNCKMIFGAHDSLRNKKSCIPKSDSSRSTLRELSKACEQLRNELFFI